jgi:hypothetical protein
MVVHESRLLKVCVDGSEVCVHTSECVRVDIVGKKFRQENLPCGPNVPLCKHLKHIGAFQVIVRGTKNSHREVAEGKITRHNRKAVAA